MKILYLTTHLNIGGVSSYVLSLARGLQQRGHTVTIASSGGELVEKIKEAGVNFIPIPIKTKAEISPKIILSAMKLAKIIRKENIEIIHANTRVTQVLGRLLENTTHRVFVATCHGFFKKRIFRRLFPCWGRKTIAISVQVKEHLIKDFGVKEDKIRVIHNGIDVDKFKLTAYSLQLTAKKALGLNDAPVIGIIARLSSVKGHIYLIQAMKEVLAQIPGAQLLIVGDGKIKDELVKLSQQLGISTQLNFMPSVSDTQSVLAAMDLFVLPSLEEGLGLALMEAMASGVGVVASNVGGITCLVRNHYTGLTVEPANPRSLAVAILELLADSEKREFLAINARNFIQQNFSLQKMVEETERFYCECLGAKV